MREYVLFQLWGPMAAWGNVAIGEVRPSLATPTRSAMIGLISGCLGLERTAEEEILQLDSSLRFGFRTDAPGSQLLDYHTVQSPGGRTSYHDFPSRKAELEVPSRYLQATLSEREYIVDACWTVAVWSDSFELAKIKEALEEPVFAPFLGRKSCPPGIPFHPILEVHPTLREAFKSYVHFGAEKFRSNSTGKRYLWEGSPDEFENSAQIQRFEKVNSRKRWQFGPTFMNEAYEEV